MSATRVLWVRFLGQIEAALPQRLVPFWKAPAGESFPITFKNIKLIFNSSAIHLFADFNSFNRLIATR